MLREALRVRDELDARGESVAAAIVICTWGSSPWPAGSRFVVSSSGETRGSVSGGCVEEDLRLRAMRVLETGTPERVSYGVSNEEAFGVGLACGGTIDVFVQPWEATARLQSIVSAGAGAVLATPVEGPTAGEAVLLDEDGQAADGGSPPAESATLARRVLDSGIALTIAVDGVDWFVEPVLPAPRLIVMGAIATADALVPMASLAGFAVHVIDTRPWLARSERYPAAASVRCGEPEAELVEMSVDSATSIVSFLHDPRLEDGVLAYALRSPARYVGSMGSRKNTIAKADRLGALGLDEAALGRLHAPIGIDIGSASPQEMAVAVLAEVVAAAHGRA